MNLITCYNPLPISFSHGNGMWLWDESGKKYLDALAGIAVCSLGHAHPEVTATIQHQASQLLHTSNIYHIPKQEELAQKLTLLAGMEQAFFCNSGAEANETALKVARLYGHKKNIANPEIIVMEKAFHGRTLGTLSASGSRKVQAGFEPLMPGFVRAPYDDLAAIQHIAKHTDTVVAIMVEPIQGEGGIIIPNPQYLRKLRELCDKHQWLLIFDEIQTGNGRTGKLFAYQHTDIKPDIVTLAKGLANGIPIGACLMRDQACDLLKFGNHGSTFGGNPLAMATALTVLEVINKQNLCDNAAIQGENLLKKLKQTLANNSQVLDIRGLGLMIGIELDRPCRDIMKLGLKHGLLFNVTAEKVIRLLPPLIVSATEVEEIVSRLEKCIQEFAIIS